jgi:hypothetical protein
LAPDLSEVKPVDRIFGDGRSHRVLGCDRQNRRVGEKRDDRDDPQQPGRHNDLRFSTVRIANSLHGRRRAAVARKRPKPVFRESAPR